MSLAQFTLRAGIVAIMALLVFVLLDLVWIRGNPAATGFADIGADYCLYEDKYYSFGAVLPGASGGLRCLSDPDGERELLGWY